jgi:hypothetical protein
MPRSVRSQESHDSTGFGQKNLESDRRRWTRLLRTRRPLLLTTALTHHPAAFHIKWSSSSPTFLHHLFFVNSHQSPPTPKFMLLFAPAIGYGGHTGCHIRPHSIISPRERYLASLSEAKEAEAEYVRSLQIERAEQARARAQQEVLREEYLRRQILREEYPYGAAIDADYERHLPLIRRHPCASERIRLARLLRQEQEEEEEEEEEERQALRHSIRVRLEQERQEQERERQLAILRRRQQEVGLKRKLQARKEREQVEKSVAVLRALLGVPEPDERTVSAGRPFCSCCEFDSMVQHASRPENPVKAGLAQTAAQNKQAVRIFVQPPVAHYLIVVQKPPKCCPVMLRVVHKPEPSSATTSSPEATVAPKATPQQSLKSELEARLGSEQAVEIKDTIRAIMASLFDAYTAPATTPQEESGKGKGKNVSFDTIVAEPTAKDIAHSFDTIQNVEASFHLLESEFVMPRKPDFTPPASPTASVASLHEEVAAPPSPKLSFTSTNAPIHNYTHALSQLLTQLDTVESYGHEGIRTRRKEVVDMVEKALEEVEGEVDQKGKLVFGKTKSPAHAEPCNGPSDATASSPDITEHSHDNDADATHPSDAAIRELAATGDVAAVTTDEPMSEPAEDPNLPCGLDISNSFSTPEGLADHTEADAKTDEQVVPTSDPAPAAEVTDRVDESFTAPAAEVSDDETPVADSTDTIVPPKLESSVTADRELASAPSNDDDQSDVMDTFLQPADLPSPPELSPRIEGDLVLVFEDGTDGDAWSEVDA